MIQEDFLHIEVEQLPSEATDWSRIRIDGLMLHTDTGHMGFGPQGGLESTRISTRMKGLRKIIEKDNGDPHSPMFTHYCTGAGCCPGGKDEALTSIIAAYTDHFSHMCVPLLYRWKHGAAANNFVKDGFFLHKILPRALQRMPAMKCTSFSDS